MSGARLRFREGQPVAVDVHNDTDTPELVHWHGQMIPSDVDDAAEEGTVRALEAGKRSEKAMIAVVQEGGPPVRDSLLEEAGFELPVPVGAWHCERFHASW